MTREAKLIVNLTRGNLVCEHVVIADTARRRMRGLLGRRSLPAGEGMLLQPSPSIHTAFMRFRIDVVFLDRNLRVVKLVPELPTWRTASALEARSTLELAAGEIARRGVEIGDQLISVDPNAPLVEDSHAAGMAADVHEDSTQSSDEEAAPTPAPQQLSRTTTVLLVGTDRRFRSVTAALLARRGVEVVVEEHMAGVDALAHRLGVDVVLLDAGSVPAAAALQMAQLRRLDPKVGVVVVSDVPKAQAEPLPVIPKWESFGSIVEAIEQARPSKAGAGASHRG